MAFSCTKVQLHSVLKVRASARVSSAARKLFLPTGDKSSLVCIKSHIFFTISPLLTVAKKKHAIMNCCERVLL